MESVNSNHSIAAAADQVSELRAVGRLISELLQGVKATHKLSERSGCEQSHTSWQLDQITQQAEAATSRVLDQVESITSREGQTLQFLQNLRRVLPATYFRNNSRVKRVMEKITENVEANRHDAYRIMDALQFQDIAAQQMQQVVSVLDEVNQRLSHLTTDQSVDSAPNP